MREILSYLGSSLASLAFVYAIFQDYFPFPFQSYIKRYGQKMVSFVSPYIQITFDEFTGEGMVPSEAYSAIQTYLSSKTTAYAMRLKGHVVKGKKPLALSMDYYEEVSDEFEGVKVWWSCCKFNPSSQTLSLSLYPTSDDKRYYMLTFHKRDRELITGDYIPRLMKEGKEIAARNKKRKLYCNSPGQSKWSSVVFEHPATFDTLAMGSRKKEEIKKDLIKFSKGKQYYASIGKAWKRGYLLHGPPGTGKSTMIVAMANFLGYDVYDLELTAVNDNTELRRLLIKTSNKSIIVIEDIDCSLDLTGQRKKEEKDEDDQEADAIKKLKDGEKKDTNSKVTLSGLLNFIDGLWSACGEERIIVFTTNHVNNLDPALIRRGRMDKHIEMSYCCFEAFKVLAKNYLNINSHPLFGEISQLLQETNMTPADVAENLMLKSEEGDEETCLKALIEALMTAKDEARKEAEEEARKKAEHEKEEENDKKDAVPKTEHEEKEKEQSALED